MKLLFIFLTALLSGHTEAQDKTSFSLRSLKNASVRTFNLANLPRPTVFLIFQSDCAACQLQVRDLKCLHDNYDVILIGAYSSENRLRKEYRRMGTPHPSYLGEDSFLESLKTKKGLTPELIVYNKNRSRHIFGLTPCADILEP